MSRKPIVFIPNKSGHDYSAAEKFGELRFLTTGTLDRYSTNSLYRVFIEGMGDFQDGDYWIISGLNILNSIGTGIMVAKTMKSGGNGVVSYLLLKGRGYVERRIDFSSLL